MENLLKLNLKKRLTMRGYQETIVSDIISNFNIGKPYVLGSCPSSGKTEMAIEALIRLIEAGHVKRVLILAHSTNVLKENFYKRLMEYLNEGDIEVMRGQKDYNYDARIQVMIPQNIKHVTGEFELVITDEAQHNVLADDGNYDRIIDMVNPKFQLLLTGTPSKFVRENALSEGDQPYYINTVGMDTIGFEHFHDVRFDLIRSAYGFTNADYNQSQDLLTDVKFSFQETETTINNVIIGAIRNIALRNGIDLPKDSDFILEGRKLVKSGKFGKTLIMCRSIEQANQTALIISKLFGVNVRVSQSQNDSDSRELERFKNGEFNFLCVVKRAREGYDDNKVLNLIDITMTHNIDLIYQMFCRVVRLDETNPKPKLYIKVTSNAEGMPEYTMNIMTAALMLGSTENLARFNGSNFRDIEMPRIHQEDDEGDDVSVNGVIDIVDTDGNVIRNRNVNELMALDLIQMFSEDHENLVNGNDRYAMTTLGEALCILSGGDFYNDKNGYFEIIKSKEIFNANQWLEKYKELCTSTGLKYLSTPWRYFKQEGKDFFEECYPEKNICENKIDYFNLIKDEKILGGDSWRNNYKLLSKKNNIKYHSTPWVIFNKTIKEFFDECYPENKFFNKKEDYFNLLKKENIINGHQWFEIFKILSDRDDVKYHSNPWNLFKQNKIEFFLECYPNKKNVFISKDEYFEIIRKGKITSSGQWLNQYKELSEKNNINCNSKPWRLFKQSQKSFFEECYPNSVFENKEDYFIFMRNEQITNSGKWAGIYKKHVNKTMYKSNPWRFFKQTNKEFFNEYKEWLKTNQSTIEYHPAYLGEFSEMNKSWNTSNSNTNYKRLKKDNTEWKTYHKLYSKAREKWSEIPYVELSKKIKGRPEWVIGDFGCGENLLSKEIKNKVHAFDFVAIDDSVVSCDLSCVPLDNNVLDVVVFSLALMGTNYTEYLKEAHRVLKPFGLVFISEPSTRWEDREDELKDKLIDAGFKISGDVRHSDRFIYVDGIK